MDRWINKVAIVTGASSGIGAAIVKVLVKKNLKVVGIARRLDKMEELKNELKNEKGSFFPIQGDISKEEDILKAFAWTLQQLGRVDILVNNAGIATEDFIIESSTENYKKIIEVNLIAPAICIREAVKIMRALDIAGHIININSTFGHSVEAPRAYPDKSFNLYAPSKFALRAMGQIVEMELKHIESNIKITNLSPGLVKTDIISEQALARIPYVFVEDISNGVIYALSTPPHVQVNELIITSVPNKKK